MIFEEITIHNLFAYYGPQRFDLRGLTDKKNIVMISGRNGYGKTNFLNSIKLLFGGVTDALRSSVQRGRKPSPRQYIMGAGDDWLGVMNVQARADGKKSCGVETVWREEKGTVRLSRTWTINANAFESNIQLDAEFFKNPLTKENEDQINHFLSERIPQSYIPYFFFDGEQIQEIAEANWNVQQQHMEKLLNIAPMERLIEHIGYVAGDWKREALDQKDKAELIRLENELKEQQAKVEAKGQTIDDISSEIEDSEANLHYLNRTIEGMAAFRNQSEEVKLKQVKADLEVRRSEIQKKIATILPRHLPLYSNLGLTGRTVDTLHEIIDSESGIQSDLLNKLAQHLPSQVFEMPPYPAEKLTQAQLNFFKERLANNILGYKANPAHWTGSLIKIDAVQAQKTLDMLLPFVHSKSFTVELADKFRDLRNIKARLHDIADQLENISTLSMDEQALYEKRVKEKNLAEGKIIDLKADLKKNQSELKAINTLLKKQQEKIKHQQERYKQSQMARKKVEKANLFKTFFQEYKNELKKLRRKAIEEAVNKHFSELMTSQTFIDKIEIGDDFDIRYMDANQNPIGMGSLSAGMKQLVATSLLWALKDVSQKNIPLIVDTPLARIDRGHQENLLRRYYPKAAQQIIVLPTDSEIDEAKYKILEPFIYREYILQNPTGYKTSVVEEKMYFQTKRVNHA